MKCQAAKKSAINAFLYKTAGGRKERDPKKREEMHSLFIRLTDLVPGMPRNRKLSKLEIIENTIDYITELEIALKVHPATAYSSHAAETSANAVRQPFGVLPPSSNVTVSSPRSEQVTATDKMLPGHIGELTSMIGQVPRRVRC
ncbi:hypothetical protein V5799_017123 [Amblyomma americanum]|uniref:BHLH domain-containing protein n=1 Tax=Amblyomma americanum TaxID=6943 RepID=A0AAQ4F4C8_AMBAM